jgi:DNA polymerase V
LDLNEYLIKHPAATFIVRVEGESMLGAGIHPNDLLIVDRSLTAKPDNIVIATLDGEFTVKRYVVEKGRQYLRPENPRFQAMDVTNHLDCRIWGVVVFVIHDFK